MNRRSFVVAAVASGIPRPVSLQISVLTGSSFHVGADECRLSDVLAPQADEPFSAESAAICSDVLGQGRLDLLDMSERDRWNRRVVRAAVETPEGVRSVQEFLVREGGARVRPESEDDAGILRLLAAEGEARAARRGLWRLAFYAVRDAAAHPSSGAFHLLEGNAVSAAVSKGRAYLNFGEDYRKDVTATASSRNVRRWVKEGLDWSALAGTRVRVRGYVSWINGPSIEVTHRRQIEIL
jgi:hypothetical protein